MVEEKQQPSSSAEKTVSFKHIVRIANVDVPGNKSIRIALTKIKGIGINFADVACTLSGIDKKKKAGNLGASEVTKLTEVINAPQGKYPTWFLNRRKDYETGQDSHVITGTLGFVTENDLKRLKKIKTLRGIRHQRKLPVRGQRTRSNFRKSKGKVVGVKKKGKK
jgi:small subunit ribosomal protein S13